jgi:hypothetical protein
LETGSLTVELTPLHSGQLPVAHGKSLNTDQGTLLHFFVRRMLAATAAELLQLQPFRHRLPVLGLRIIPLFAITALQRNDLSGHENSS